MTPPESFLPCIALTVMCMLIQTNTQNTVPDELLPVCNEQEELDDILSIVNGLSAIKRAPKSNLYEKMMFRRFSGPFSENIPLPWSCSLTPAWRDLGDDYFPRFIRDGTCNNRTCWYRHYECRPVLYSLSVLQRQNSECFDQSLPGSLSTDWRMRTITVTSSCMCQRM